MIEITIARINGGDTKSDLPIEVVYRYIGRQPDPIPSLRTIYGYEKRTLDTIKDSTRDTDLWSNFILRDHLLARGCKRNQTIHISMDGVLTDLDSILDMDKE